MSSSLAAALVELALANRIAAHEGVLDVFGHVSMRHPEKPGRYFLSRSRAPELIDPEDFIEYDLESKAVAVPGAAEYSERVIHGEIYKARPDVMAVCHHHAPAFMPLLATGTDYVPVFHLGAVGGLRPPFWDQHDEFGDTNMLVVKPEQGASLARALGGHWMVLMRRHGVTVAGTSVRECVYRAVNSCRNADFQVRAMTIGKVASLWPGEVERAMQMTGKTTGLARAWEYWTFRLPNAGALIKPRTRKARRAAAKALGRVTRGKKRRR